MPVCGPRLDENFFLTFLFVCLSTIIRLITLQIKACGSIFNTQADIIQAGDEWWTENVMAFELKIAIRENLLGYF